MVSASSSDTGIFSVVSNLEEEGEIPAVLMYRLKKFIPDFPNSLFTGLITIPNF